MKKNVLFFAIFLIGANLFAQDYELSSRLIQKFETSRQNSLTKSATVSDHLWLTPLLAEANRNWDNLTKEAQEYFKDYRNRPTFTGTEEVVTYGNFAFHYTTDGPADESVDPTDNDGNYIPDYVDFMAETFVDEIYELYHTTTGLTVPPADGTNGGDALYDVYISGSAAGSGVYGYVAGETEIGDNPNSTSLTEVDAYTSYMVMRNNYSGFSGTEAVCIGVTSAHEYMHAVQNGYTGNMDTWFMEMCATWSEEFAYSGYDDNFQYLMGLFGKPDVALNLEDGEDSQHDGHWYSSWLFAKYLTEHTGNSIVKSIYERCINDYAAYAIDDELTANWSSSIEQQFKNFVVANVVMDNNSAYSPYTYQRASDYETHVDNNGGLAFEYTFNYSGTNITFNSQTDGNNRLMRLSSDYFQLTSTGDFRMILTPVTPSDELEFILLKINETNSTISVQPANIVSNQAIINITDYSSWEYFVPIVIRHDIDVEDINPSNYSILVTAADYSSVEENSNTVTVNLYPNPSSDYINIEINNYVNGKMEFELYDITGKLSKTWIPEKNNRYDISDLSEGVYTLKTSVNGSSVLFKKIIIAR